MLGDTTSTRLSGSPSSPHFKMASSSEKSHMSFLHLGLNECLAKQCNSMGMKKPTEIQVNCIPPILQGRDCIGCAKTGSGKTAAFALPILQKLCEDPYGIFAVVLTPTRELAYQIAEQFRALGKPVGVRDCITVGGLDMMKQGLELSQHPHIVIATPGRLADHLRSTDTVSLKKIKFLVLDEADRLLEDTFAEDLQTIFDAAPENRQTLLFSATLTDTIEQLKAISASDPFCFQVESDIATVEELDQRYVLMPALVKDCYLVYLLREHSEEKSSIVFTSTCVSCQVLSLMLKRVGLPCAALHSLMSQTNRLSSLAKFKSGIVKILVATDVANRGLDIPSVELVLNSNVPKSPKDYIHRVGRTARAGRGGMAVTLVTQYDVNLVKRVEDHINVKLSNFEVPEKDALKLLKGVNVARREVELRVKDSAIDEKRIRNKRKRLILHGKDPDQSNKKKAT